MVAPALTAISSMIAPVVVVSSAAVLTTGIQVNFLSINDRIREMNHERLTLLTDDAGRITTKASLSGAKAERLHEVDRQLPLLTRRHHMLQHTLLTMYVGVLVVVLSMVAIAAGVTAHATWLLDVALGLVLGGTLVILAALALLARALRLAHDAIDFEVQRVLELG
jgi:hypothetical protein